MMVWAHFMGDVGREGLYFLSKNVTLNGEPYKEALENHLLPFLESGRQCLVLR